MVAYSYIKPIPPSLLLLLPSLSSLPSQMGLALTLPATPVFYIHLSFWFVFSFFLFEGREERTSGSGAVVKIMRRVMFEYIFDFLVGWEIFV